MTFFCLLLKKIWRRAPPTDSEGQKIRFELAEFDNDDWLDEEEPLTVHERALLDARVAAYAKDPDAGSTWEGVEGRIRARLAVDRINRIASMLRPSDRTSSVRH